MRLEVFFDYACPFCLRGHQYLKELLPNCPKMEVDFRPCEAHPRPERHGIHSDLCIQGMFFAAENGVDLWAYHALSYSLILERGVNVEDVDALCPHYSELLDADALREALVRGKYRKMLSDANDYAYEKSGVWAVPAYRMHGRRLDSVEGIGVTKAQLQAFLSANQ